MPHLEDDNNEEYLQAKSEECKIPVEELTLIFRECGCDRDIFENRITSNRNCSMLEAIENIKRMKLNDSCGDEQFENADKICNSLLKGFKYVIGTGIVPLDQPKAMKNQHTDKACFWLPAEICQDPLGAVSFIIVFGNKTTKFRVNEKLTVGDIKWMIEDHIQTKIKLLRIGTELLDDESVKFLKNFVIDAIVQ